MRNIDKKRMMGGYVYRLEKCFHRDHLLDNKNVQRQLADRPSSSSSV